MSNITVPPSPTITTTIPSTQTVVMGRGLSTNIQDQTVGICFLAGITQHGSTFTAGGGTVAYDSAYFSLKLEIPALTPGAKALWATNGTVRDGTGYKNGPMYTVWFDPTNDPNVRQAIALSTDETPNPTYGFLVVKQGANWFFEYNHLFIGTLSVPLDATFAAIGITPSDGYVALAGFAETTAAMNVRLYIQDQEFLYLGAGAAALVGPGHVNRLRLEVQALGAGPAVPVALRALELTYHTWAPRFAPLTDSRNVTRSISTTESDAIAVAPKTTGGRNQPIFPLAITISSDATNVELEAYEVALSDVVGGTWVDDPTGRPVQWNVGPTSAAAPPVDAVVAAQNKGTTSSDVVWVINYGFYTGRALTIPPAGWSGSSVRALIIRARRTSGSATDVRFTVAVGYQYQN